MEVFATKVLEAIFLIQGTATVCRDTYTTESEPITSQFIPASFNDQGVIKNVHKVRLTIHQSHPLVLLHYKHPQQYSPQQPGRMAVPQLRSHTFLWVQTLCPLYSLLPCTLQNR